MPKTGAKRKNTASKQARDKAVPSSRDDPPPLRPPPSENPATTTAPWPHPQSEDGKPFIDCSIPLVPHMTYAEFNDDKYRNRHYGISWQPYNSICYNGLHRVQILPTRIICPSTLRRMGIEQDVLRLLNDMGLGKIASTEYKLYPEAVRQFLASCELTYENRNARRASEGTLSFLYKGKLYETTIHQLCTIYGFATSPELVRFPDDDISRLWDFIGTRGERPGKLAKLTKIRSPVLRVVAKIIGATLFAKEETGSTTAPELLLIHRGLPSSIASSYTHPQGSQSSQVNLGAVFAGHLVGRKLRGLNTANHVTDSIGSLLTPIFLHHKIDFSGEKDIVETISRFDEQYFRNAHYLRSDFQYRFFDRDDVDRIITLPKTELTSITSAANVEFLPPLDVAPYDPAISRRRKGFSRAPQPHLENDFVYYDYPPPPAQHSESMEFLLPEYIGQYDPPPLAADASDRERMDWLIESQRGTHSMLKSIWGAFARMPCLRPPTCLRVPLTRSPSRDGAGSSQATCADVDPVRDDEYETEEEEEEEEPVVRRRPRR